MEKETKKMHTGKIKKLARERTFGFINDADDGREIFFHKDSLLDIEYNALTVGQKVQFEIEDYRNGPRAVNISIVK